MLLNTPQTKQHSIKLKFHIRENKMGVLNSFHVWYVCLLRLICMFVMFDMYICYVWYVCKAATGRQSNCSK